MKRMGAVMSLLVWLAGCGSPGEPQEDPTEVEGVPPAESSHKISISFSEGMNSSQHYTYFPAKDRLEAYWSRYGHGPGGGYRTQSGGVQLTPDQAQDLEARLNNIRLDTTNPIGECWEDMPTINLAYFDIVGQSQSYYTDPRSNDCGGSRLFVNKEDLQAVLDTCRALLPEPAL